MSIFRVLAAVAILIVWKWGSDEFILCPAGVIAYVWIVVEILRRWGRRPKKIESKFIPPEPWPEGVPRSG